MVTDDELGDALDARAHELAEAQLDAELDDGKVTCPYCSRRVAMSSTGKLSTHAVKPRGGARCVRSGART